ELLSFFELRVGGPESGAEAAEILRQIQSGEEPEAVRLRARVFPKRPRPAITDAFGKDFTDRLVALPRSQWSTLQSSDGWHIVRIDNIEPGRRAEFEDIRAQLTEDVKQARIRAAALAKIREMGKSFVIRRSDQP